MPVVCQATQMQTSSLVLPIQLNLVASNCAALLPSSGSKASAAVERCRTPGRPWAPRCRGNWRAGCRRRPPCSSAPAPDCREVAAHVARQDARIGVVAAADAGADIHLDGLALVEIGRPFARCAGALTRQLQQARRCERSATTHGRPQATLASFSAPSLRLNSRIGVAAEDVALGGLAQERQVVDRRRQVEIPVRIVGRIERAASPH